MRWRGSNDRFRVALDEEVLYNREYQSVVEADEAGTEHIAAHVRQPAMSMGTKFDAAHIEFGA